MSKARDIRLHEETMEKLDTLSCQLHSLSNTVRRMQDNKPAPVTIPVKASSFWEQQCREKDATLTETLRKLQAAEGVITQQREKIGAMILDQMDSTNNWSIDCPATRAALNAIINDYLLRQKVGRP